MSTLQIRKLRVGNGGTATRGQNSDSGLYEAPSHAVNHSACSTVVQAQDCSLTLFPGSPHFGGSHMVFWTPGTVKVIQSQHPSPAQIPPTARMSFQDEELPTHLFWPLELFLALKRVRLPIISPLWS